MTRSAGLNLQGRARTVAAATLPALVALAASASPGCSDGATDTKCEPRRECDPQKLASQQDDGCGGILECPSTRGAIASLALQTQMAARLEIPLENVQKRFIRFTRPPVHGTAAVGADRIVFEPGPEISGTDSMRIAFWTDAAKTRQIEVTYK
ncbi:MAG TPA: hypothetical protein VM580_34805, partial [Labilithrix sp.]|nr:hypothetical protein [Labilithrix sp.]